MSPVAEWLLALALQFAPPSQALRFPGYDETADAARARYTIIAEDIAFVVQEHEPLPGLTRSESAVFVLAMSIGETALALDADKGPCFRGRHLGRNYAGRCDSGRAVGVLQVQLASGRAEHFADRRKLLTVGLTALRGSLWACAQLPVDERLAAYASGSCNNEGGKAGSRKRWALFSQILNARPLPKVAK
jgi:hypothetical protein